MAMSGRQYPIAAGQFTATIAEVGAGLREFRLDGTEITCAYGTDTLPPKGCGMTLVPWPNRIRGGKYTFDGVEQQLGISEPAFGNASHGLGRWARWELAEHAADRVTLRLDVVPQNGWPHEVRIEITYALDARRGLEVTVVGSNHGTTHAPFGAGNHPYLSARGVALDEVIVQVPADTVLTVDDAKIPVGREPVAGTRFDLRDGAPLADRRFDDCFTDLAYVDGVGSAEVRSAAGGARLWFADMYRYLQAYTLDKLTDAGGGVALEPMSCPANAFNSNEGLVVLEPGDTWTGHWGVAPL